MPAPAFENKVHRLEKQIARTTDRKKRVALEREFVSIHISHHEKDLGMSHPQAVASALSEARKRGYSAGAYASSHSRHKMREMF